MIVMKRQLSTILAILFVVCSAAAQKAKETRLEKNLREHVTYLASEELEGRKTGEKGGTFAAGYVANMFQRFKLQPGFSGADGRKSFLQPFEFISGVEPGDANYFTVNGEAVEREAHWMPIGFSPNAEISNVPIVFAGFGITAADLDYDDYDGLDPRGKIVLVLAGTPDSGNPHSGFGRFGIHAKSNLAKEKGAVAMVVISNTPDFADEKLAMRFDQRLGDLALPSIVVSRSAASGLLGTDLAGLKEIETWIERRAEAPDSVRIRLADPPDLDASLSVEIVKKKAEAYNVIGIIPGRDKALRDEAIVIGAHYDHLGRGGESSLAPDSTEIHHGADDNASGTSSLLELARQMRKAKDNKRTIIFIAFGGEEEGLLGSKAYVENPAFPLENTIAMINMDMVGRLKNDKLTIGGIGTADVWKDLVERLNSGTLNSDGLKARKLPEPKIPGEAQASVVMASVASSAIFDLQLNQDGFGPSDHSSFYGKKVPVLFFFTGTHEDYHKPSDTSDKINYGGLAKINGFVAEIVNYLDARSEAPVYKVAESSSMGASRRGFNVSLGTIPSYSDSANDGLAIDGVRADSPAAKAGLESGDKIIKLAGREIKNISDYMFVLGEMKAGEEYEVTVLRGEERIVLTIVPEGRN